MIHLSYGFGGTDQFTLELPFFPRQDFNNFTSAKRVFFVFFFVVGSWSADGK